VQVIGAIAEFERFLVQERVRACLRNAKAKGQGLGRPRDGRRREDYCPKERRTLVGKDRQADGCWRGHSFPNGTGIR
jgi:DNA invertase Pin-like site-specific DNA recombinase